MISIIELFEKSAGYLTGFALQMQAEKSKEFLGIDMSIEGLRSQEYSYGIFGFLVVSLIFFAIIIWLYVPKKGNKGMKTGEKIMFGAIISGIFIAIAMGYLQLVDGYLL